MISPADAFSIFATSSKLFRHFKGVLETSPVAKKYGGNVFISHMMATSMYFLMTRFVF